MQETNQSLFGLRKFLKRALGLVPQSEQEFPEVKRYAMLNCFFRNNSDSFRMLDDDVWWGTLIASVKSASRAGESKRQCVH